MPKLFVPEIRPCGDFASMQEYEIHAWAEHARVGNNISIASLLIGFVLGAAFVAIVYLISP